LGAQPGGNVETVFDRIDMRDRERKKEIREFEKRNRIPAKRKLIMLALSVIALAIVLHIM
jgi:hypothetical protein